MTCCCVPGNRIAVQRAQARNPRVFVPTVKTAVGAMGQLGQGTSLFVCSVNINLYKSQEFNRD